MKVAAWMVLAGALQAGEIEGTVWYDSEGEVAWVEGPAAEKTTREPFVPHWVRAERRRERRAGRRPGFRVSRWYFRGVGCYPATVVPGWSCRPVAARGHRVAAAPFRGVRPVRVIIR